MKLDFDIDAAPLEGADYRAFRAILDVRAALRAVTPVSSTPLADRTACSFTRAGLDRLVASRDQGKERLNLCGSMSVKSGGVETLQQPGDGAAGVGESVQGSYA